MTGFGFAVCAELAHLRRDRFDLALVTLAPLLFLALMAGMIVAGTPEGLSVVVIDRDHSTASRAVIRAIDRVPALAVAGQTDSFDDALAALRRERAVAIVILPEGLGTLRSGLHPPSVQILYQTAFLSTGTLSSVFLRASIAGALAERVPGAAGVGGVALVRVPLPGVQVTILGNPGLSLEWYLGLLLGPAILHLLVAVLCVASVGREIEDRSLAPWARRVSGSPTTPAAAPAAALAATLAGRLAPYVAIGSLWGILWLFWLTLARGYRFDGQIALVALGLVLLFAATAAISALLVVLTREVATSLSVSVIYAGSALAYSGASLPITGAPLIPRLWSGALPLTHYITLQMDQVIDAEGRAWSIQAGILLLYVAVCGGGAVLLLLHRMARSRA